jgi:hypothetical protein
MKKIFVLLSVFAVVFPVPLRALGLAMRFNDVTLENVEPGTRVNLRVARNLPLVVINQSDNNETDVLVETMIPNPKDLKEGYEPIPDATWIQAIPDRFHLGPRASASTDVLINIPNDSKLIGHHYEAIVFVHTDQKNKVLPEGGILFQVGLKSTFRISIGTRGPAALQREKALKKLVTINTNFSLTPDNLFVREVPVGKVVDLKADFRAAIKVVNQSDESVSLKIKSVEPDPNVQPQATFEFAPDAKWLEVSPQKLTVGPNSIKELKMKLKIPDKPEYRGKKFAFLVLTSLSDETLPLAYYNIVYVATAP